MASKPTEYVCPKCNRVIAKQDRRRNNPTVVIPPAKEIIRPNESMRIKCQCNHVIVILTASAT